MRGVAREEDMAAAVGPGEPVLHLDPRRPGDRGDAGGEAGSVEQVLQLTAGHARPPRPRPAGGEQPPRGALARREREEQAGRAGRNGHGGRREPVELDVGEHDLLPVPPAAPGDAGACADRAARPVATGEEGAAGPLDARRRAQHGIRPVEVHQLGVPLHPHAAGGERGIEYVLDVGLEQQRQRRVRRAGQRHVARTHAQDPAAQMQPDLGHRTRPLQQCLEDAKGSQDLQGARLHQDGVGRAEPLGPPLHDAHPGPVRGRLQRQGQPGRASPDHEDVRDHAATSRHQSGPFPGTAVRGAASTASRRSPGTTA